MKQKAYFGDKINRVKLHKKGKLWVISSATFLSMGLSLFNLAHPVHATVQHDDAVVLKTTAIKSSQPTTSQVAAAHSATSQVASSANATSQNSQAVSHATSVTSATSQANNKSITVSATASVASQAQTSASSSSQAKQTSASAATSVASVAAASATNSAASQVSAPASLASQATSSAAASVTSATTSAATSQHSKYGVLDADYGAWTIYFQDENGNTIHSSIGYDNASANDVTSDLLPTIELLQAEGYQYVDNSVMSFPLSLNFDLNYVTLIFKKVPRAAGGVVTVKYVTNSGKVLATTTATYLDAQGNNDATPHMGDTYITKAKNFTGYTLLGTPDNQVGFITPNAQTVTYVYAPMMEHTTIAFIDQDEGTVLNSVQVAGAYGSTATFDVAGYIAKNYPNYTLVSTTWPANGVVMDNNSSKQTYQVILAHKVAKSTQTKTITQTIHYQYSNGKQAFPDKVTKIVFTRSVTTDEVTGTQTFGSWQNTSGTDEFPSIPSPQIPGYTASFSSTTAITNITPNSANNTQTVVYVPNKEEMTLTIYDMDEHKILQQKIFEGDYNTSPNYDYQSVLANYEKQGYQIARDTIPASGLVFNNTGDQNYEVDLTHTTTKLPADAKGLTKVITHTIHYVYGNGKQAKPDVVQSITYTRGATKDNVTGQITYTDWTTTTNPAQFPSVPTPVIKGYTPSQTASGVVPVNGNSQDSAETIVYTPNGGTQKPQSDTKTTVTETINYIDNNGTKLLPSKVVTITFTRYQNVDGTYSPWEPVGGKNYFDAVQAPVIKGYTPDKSMIPAIKNITATTANIVKTIVYSPAQEQIVVNYIDTTTGQTIKTDQLSGTYGSTSTYDVNSIIQTYLNSGYKLVSSDVPATLNFDTAGVQTYTVKLAHTYTTTTQTKDVIQTIKYVYADGTQAADPKVTTLTFTRSATKDNVTGKSTYGAWTPTSGTFPAVPSPVITGYTPSRSASEAIDDVTGDSDNNIQIITYNPIQETVKVNYVDQTTGTTITTATLTGAYGTHSNYTTADAIKQLESRGYTLVKDGFPADGFVFGKSADVYTVTLKETIKNSTQTQTVTQTINYETAGGKQVAAPHTATLTFTRSVATNEVTGKSTYGAWTPTTATFPAVTSPQVTGYTTNTPASDAVTVAADNPKNVMQTIIYVPNQEKVVVQYYDQTTNKVLSSVTLTGAYDTTSNYNPAPVIADYVHDGYQLVKDEFPVGGVTFNQDGSVPTYQIIFAHNTRVDTTDNNPDKVADLSKTVTETIKYQYSNGTQAATPVTKQVTFTRSATVDQVTHQVIAYSNWSPASDTLPAVESPTITKYEKEGYQLVNNGVPADGITFDKDGNYSPYQVTFKHGTTTTTESKTVSETIHYVDNNGKSIAADKVEQTTFSRPAITDNVTHTVTYGQWSPASDALPAVESPTIMGYTPDKAEVPAVTVSGDSENSTVTVTYTPDTAKITVKYIDDTTGKVLKIATLQGSIGQKSIYNPNEQIKQYEQQGYQLVNDDYPQGGATFINGVQTYTIHLRETTTTFTPTTNPDHLQLTDVIHQVIHYQYENGHKAFADKVTTITFTRTATKNNVTGQVTYSNWTPVKATFAPVASPVIAGYTPSAQQSTPVTVKPGDNDNVQTIIYTPDQSTVTITYIDQTTGKTLRTDTLTGSYREHVPYDPQTIIANYEKHGYQLVNSDYPAQGAVFGKKPTSYRIYLKHHIVIDTVDHDPDHLDNLTHVVKRTIHYQYEDGRQAEPDVVEIVKFVRSAQVDEVTHQVIYG